MILKVFVLCFSLIASVSLRATTYICDGASWKYKFEIEGVKCDHERKAKEDIPGIYKKGKIVKLDKMNSEHCWTSMAMIQMDTAKCCEYGPKADVNISCSARKIKY